MNSQISQKQSITACKRIVIQFDPVFYGASLLLPRPQRQALWAVYAWFRQKDEFIDSDLSQTVKRTALRRWFEQLETLFNHGIPSVPTDLALVEAIYRYHIPIGPFQEMLLGQEMDWLSGNSRAQAPDLV